MMSDTLETLLEIRDYLETRADPEYFTASPGAAADLTKRLLSRLDLEILKAPERLKEAASAEIRYLWDRLAALEAELDELKAENWGLKRRSLPSVGTQC